MRDCNKGFTLIELIIVLIIIGLASGLVGIVISRNSGSFEMKRITKDLSAVLRYARNQAITEKKTYCFVIDKKERIYTVYTDRTKVESADESTESADNSKGKYIQVINKPIPEEMEMTVQGNDSDSPFIEFFPVGNSTGGVVEVSNRKGNVYYITVNRITGKVDIGRGDI
ncbi:MAG: prepilin-type N-terminal cleavage/methylation domain-containing protein [Nitrospiraceae bacterium]|nr:MAG: prepilin-type N-terminal cleavage/methylation domain-containing protein [Nitrospiraceae bacterium]